MGSPGRWWLAVTAPDRWEPDEQLVAAVMSSPKASRRMTELADPDRCWLVAGLTLAGMTAQDIADRTGCSLRLIRAIRAEPMTQVCVYAHQQVGALSDSLRGEQIDHAATRLELARARDEADRLRMQVDQLLDALTTDGRIETFPRCGHPKVRYNVYAHRGKKYCRECRRNWQAQHRAARRAAG
ncbi:hypothetical protein H7I62_01840 [Mycolicibacterium thermoresistibile]|nr:hypothetical protein [Mycolicibacterium thermoresistibile]